MANSPTSNGRHWHKCIALFLTFLRVAGKTETTRRPPESERKPVNDETSTTDEVYPSEAPPANYGLHAGVLGPLETLAQSVSAMAPSTSASLTIPLVFALAGSATWFVYLLATATTLLVGFCVSRFARLSASPGSKRRLERPLPWLTPQARCLPMVPSPMA